MSFPPHITDAQIGQYAANTLSPTDWDTLGLHLHGCESCQQRLALASDFAGHYDRLVSQFPIDASMHPDFQRLTQYAEEQGDSEEQEIIRRHLAVCQMCQTEVHDLRQMTEAIVPDQVTERPAKLAFTTRKPLTYAIAASIAVLAVVIISRIPYGVSLPPDVSVAINTQKIEFTDPAVRALVAAGDTETAPVAQTLTIVSPANIAVREPIPTFTWSDTISAHKYRISILANGHVLSSESQITSTHWQPKQAMPQGTVLHWRLETLGADAQKLEAPFLILTGAENAKISQAEQRYAKNPLVLGTIYAQAGLFEEAEHALTSAVKADPKSSAAQTLLRQVQALHPSSSAFSQ